jgi:hypothetical protein
MREERFATPAGLRLKLALKIPHGSIEVEALEGDETTVELEALRGNEASAQAVKEAQIELRPLGVGLELVVDATGKKRFLGWFGGQGLRLHVTAPPGADLELVSASADVDVRGRFGALEVQTASGDIRADELTATVNVKSGSGDVEIRRIGGDVSIATASGDVELGTVGGDLTARAASGDIEVEEVGGSVTMQTASGDQRVGAVSSGKVKLQSASGDQHIGIRSGSRAYIDAKAWGGETHSELEISSEPIEGDGPELEVRATAASGDITIARA